MGKLGTEVGKLGTSGGKAGTAKKSSYKKRVHGTPIQEPILGPRALQTPISGPRSSPRPGVAKTMIIIRVFR